MAIFLSFTERTRRAGMLERPAPRRWFETPNGWHISAPDLAPVLIDAVRNRRFNEGRFYFVLACEPDGSSCRVPGEFGISAAIALADERQGIAEASGNALGMWFQVRTLTDFPVYMTKGGRQ